MTVVHGSPVALRQNRSRGPATLVHRRGSRDRDPSVDPAHLDEVPFEELVCRLAFGHNRSADTRTWVRLLEPDLVVRTSAALQRAHERNQSAMETRREQWLRYAEERVGVKVHPGEWDAARQDYADWQERAGKFEAVIGKAIREVDRVKRKQEREAAAGEQVPELYRRQLKAVAEAIMAHRSALEDGDVIAEEHDLQLWSALDTVTVPHGPLSEPTSLMAMLTERHWS